MILNQLSHRDRSKLDADIVVVGAGPAGLALASRLAMSHRHLLVLDSGGMTPEPDHDAARAAVRGPLPYFRLADCRPRGLGGSSGLWGGWCEPLNEFDFEQRPGMTGSGWCLTRHDLEPYYRQARSFCGIPEATPSRPWRLAHETGVLDSPFEPYTFPVLGPRQLGHRYADLFAADGTDLLLNATVTRLIMNDDGTAVDHLVVETPAGRLAVSCNHVVLAAGGIETARLLLASTSQAWPDGVGNGNDLVGRCFMEHPHVDAMRFLGDPDAFDVEFFLERRGGTTLDGEPMAAAGALLLSEEACRAWGIGQVQLFIEPAGNHADHPLPREWNGRPLRLRPQPPRAGELTVIAATEQFPNLDSRITLGEAVDRFGVPVPILTWELTGLDHRTALLGVEAVRPLLEAFGAREIRRRLPRRGWPTDTLGGPHHLGTTRMARSESEGVVDGDCRVHGVANLFIAGGAVFPTSGHAPPTLTIAALSLRLADHLSELGRSDPTDP